MHNNAQAGKPQYTVSKARLVDLEGLMRLEQLCFDPGDQLSRRSMRHFTNSDTANLLIAANAKSILGYILILYRSGTHLARMYSLAVDPAARRLGIAEQLILKSEQEAADEECIFMRLEVRIDNETAIHLYKRLGYHKFGTYRHYYADQQDALRLQKRIIHYEHSEKFRPVKYYSQTTEFTCGSASLMMAMHALDNNFPLNRTLELQLWREATTIFMTSGHGGCGPHGLALAAWQRGFNAVIHINQKGPLFLEGVRQKEKKSVMTLVHEDFIRQIRANNIKIIYQALTLDQLSSYLDNDYFPLVLISTYRLNRNKAPHWVIITAIDKHFVYFHDPEIDEELGYTDIDNQYLPISHNIFERISRFGRNQLRAAVMIYKESKHVDKRL